MNLIISHFKSVEQLVNAAVTRLFDAASNNEPPHWAHYLIPVNIIIPHTGVKTVNGALLDD